MTDIRIVLQPDEVEEAHAQGISVGDYARRKIH